MKTPFQRVQPVLKFVAAHLDQDLSLKSLAARTGLSVFHLHRVFSASAGETLKQFTLRMRLGRAAVMLLTGDDSVLNVALESGFQSHEVFCRAFRRRFGMAPGAYRARGFATAIGVRQAAAYAVLVNQVGPCIGLYHMSSEVKSEGNDMTYSITKKELPPQPVLVVRRKVKRSEIAAAIAEALPHVFRYAQQNGLALSGLPFTRYVEGGLGMLTIEPGMRIAAPGHNPGSADPDVVPDTLPGGPAAVTMHVGPYDKLSDAYAAIEQWMNAEGLVAGGAPWESYVTDPGDYPDPADWKTEVFWPLAG